MRNTWNTITGNHEGPATLEVLEQQVDIWDERIANWKPPTAWEAANQRQLKCYKMARGATVRAIAKLEEKEKDLRKKNRGRLDRW